MGKVGHSTLARHMDRQWLYVSAMACVEMLRRFHNGPAIIATITARYLVGRTSKCRTGNRASASANRTGLRSRRSTVEHVAIG